jgi:hypothetical protein
VDPQTWHPRRTNGSSVGDDPYALCSPKHAAELRARDEKVMQLADFLDQSGRPMWIRLKRVIRIGRRSGHP